MQIHGDPEAADIVFTSGADIVVVGINITTQVCFTGLVIDTLICFKSSSGVNYTHHVRFCCFRWGPSGAKKLEREACTVLVWYGQVLKGLACQVWWFPRYMKIICFCYAFSKYPRIWKKNHMLIFSYITFVLVLPYCSPIELFDSLFMYLRRQQHITSQEDLLWQIIFTWRRKLVKYRSRN